MTQGTFIVIDAIDGAGKQNVIDAIVRELESRGLKSFNAVTYQKTHHTLPEATDPEVAAADILVTAEPTYVDVGNVIRQELIAKHQDGRTYDGRVTAQAFSIDRLVHFSKLVLPFLRARPNRWVIQDRGVITSLAYQPLQDSAVTLDWLLSLEGNRLELSRPPEALLLLRLSADEAQKRIAGRTEKTDNAIFEVEEFQKKLSLRYEDEAILHPYRSAGTRIEYIDASRSKEEVAAAAIEAIQALLPVSLTA